MANEDGKVLKKKVNINRLKPFVERCGGESPKRKRAKVEPPSGDESGETDGDSCTYTQLNLSRTDLDDIEHGRWLNDKVVSAAQKLIKDDKELLQVGGLQNTVRSQTLSFKVAKKEFVQILHQGGNHWITVSTVGVEHPHVRVYDSRQGLLQDRDKKVTRCVGWSMQPPLMCPCVP